MRNTLLIYGLAAAMALPAAPVAARDRYATPPPVMVSPDLSAPWVLQLRKAPKRVSASQQQRREPAFGALVQPQRQYRQGDIVTINGIQRKMVRKEVHPDINPMYLPQQVDYAGPQKPGTIVIDTRENFLYLVQAGGTARRYGVGTGKPGFEWAGTHKVSRKAVWPDWRPPAEMISRERAKGRVLPAHMEGGPDNPLGARALYLGSTLYRIHGTNQPWTIGGAVSSGCIRMRNEDVVDLYERVEVGTKVVVM
ncbi:MAG: L,D-transpeptidase [Rhizobiaceae bacterium]|nr:L,D-transpeptidase [Rhizobiaceae bacterium]